MPGRQIRRNRHSRRAFCPLAQQAQAPIPAVEPQPVVTAHRLAECGA